MFSHPASDQAIHEAMASIETIKQRVIISRSAETQTEAEAVDWTRATDAASDLSGFCCCELLLTGVRASRPTAVLIKPVFQWIRVSPRRQNLPRPRRRDVRRALERAGDAGMLGMLVEEAPRRAASMRPGGQLCGGRQLPGDLEASSPCRELRPLARATEHQCLDTGSAHRG